MPLKLGYKRKLINIAIPISIKIIVKFKYFKDLIGSFSTNMVSQSIINQLNPLSPLVANPPVINLSIL